MGHLNLLTLHQWRGILMSSKRKLYSYVRWSSEKQSAGTSFERQTSKARQFAQEHDLEYEEITDAGVSAFKGKNTTQGKLGEFIAAVKQGMISPESWLYVENLDRLSREDVATANELFLNLLRQGLTIVTGMDDRIYTLESVNKNPMELMASILMFMRANEESRTKSNRVMAHTMALIERHQNGLDVNIKAVGKHPFWIDDSGPASERVRPHPEHWEAAKEAVELFLQGHGAFFVTDYLNQHYPVPPIFKKTKRKAGGWPVQALKKMRDNLALVGTRILSLAGKEYRLENYYPPLCSLGEFEQLQNIKVNNRRSSGKVSTAINLLGGMKILRCGHCNGTMTAFLHRGQLRYICEYGRSGGNCTAWSVKASIVERCLMPVLVTGYLMGAYKTHHDISLLNSQIDELQAELSDIKSQLERLIDAIAEYGRSTVIDNKYRGLERKEREISGQLQELSRSRALYASMEDVSDDIVDFVLEQCYWPIVSDVHNPKREPLRESIRRVIDSVFLSKSNGCIRIEFRLLTGEPFVFAGSQPGEFDIFLPKQIHDIPEDATEDEIAEWQRSDDAFNKNFRKLWYEIVNDGYLAHYPKIEGKDFWPKR